MLEVLLDAFEEPFGVHDGILEVNISRVYLTFM